MERIGQSQIQTMQKDLHTLPDADADDRALNARERTRRRSREETA